MADVYDSADEWEEQDNGKLPILACTSLKAKNGNISISNYERLLVQTTNPHH